MATAGAILTVGCAARTNRPVTATWRVDGAHGAPYGTMSNNKLIN